MHHSPIRRLLSQTLIFALVLALPQRLAAQTAPLSRVTIKVSSQKPKQGDVLVIRLTNPDTTPITGALDARTVQFVPDGAAKVRDANLIGMVGIDGMLAPGPHTLAITSTDGAVITQSISVQSGGFITEQVKLPEKLKSLIEPVLSAKEEAEFKQIYTGFTITQTWSGPFQVPVKGKILSRYGNRRIYNGVNLGTYHTGIDIPALLNRPVRAAADGTVVLVKRFAVRGNVVVLDHGRGVFTAYFHLVSSGVKVGQAVKAGDIIAQVGSTGRSQGNHLHFEIAVGGVPVNPEPWLKAALP